MRDSSRDVIDTRPMTPEKLAIIGTALYGERWQTPLANDLQVADRTMRRWLAGESPIPESIAAELLALFERRKRTLNALTDYSINALNHTIMNVRTNSLFAYDGAGRLTLRDPGFAKPDEMPAIADGAQEALRLELQRDPRTKAYWVDRTSGRMTATPAPHTESSPWVEEQEYHGYNLQAVQHPPVWQVNIYITRPNMIPPNPFDMPASSPSKEAALADARRRVDRLLGTRKLHGIEEKISLGGRITTILDELRRGSSGVYTFRLGEKTIKGSRDLRYFVNVVRGNSSEQFDISKEDFERLRGMNVPVGLHG
ncbi:MAG TPA: hypothetical protein VN823_14460 [Stellaceae bacterium]|nr:hypothetical protein [Stellaceae bacterium]